MSERLDVRRFVDDAGDELEVHANDLDGEVFIGAFEMDLGVHSEDMAHVGLSFGRATSIAIAKWILELTGGE